MGKARGLLLAAERRRRRRLAKAGRSGRRDSSDLAYEGSFDLDGFSLTAGEQQEDAAAWAAAIGLAEPHQSPRLGGGSSAGSSAGSQDVPVLPVLFSSGDGRTASSSPPRGLLAEASFGPPPQSPPRTTEVLTPDIELRPIGTGNMEIGTGVITVGRVKLRPPPAWPQDEEGQQRLLPKVPPVGDPPMAEAAATRLPPAVPPEPSGRALPADVPAAASTSASAGSRDKEARGEVPISGLGDVQKQLLRSIEGELRKELRSCRDFVMKAVLTKVEAERKAFRAQVEVSWKASIEEEAAVRRALATHLEARISSLASGMKTLNATVQRAAAAAAASAAPSPRSHPTALAALPECTEQELLARMEEAVQAETAARLQLEQELRQELRQEQQRGPLASDLEAAGKQLGGRVDGLAERLEHLEQQQQQLEGDGKAVHDHAQCRAAMESMLQESLSGLLELVDEKLGQGHKTVHQQLASLRNDLLQGTAAAPQQQPRHNHYTVQQHEPWHFHSGVLEVPFRQQQVSGQPLPVSDGCSCSDPSEHPHIDIVASPPAAIHWPQKRDASGGAGGNNAVPLRSQRQLSLVQGGLHPAPAATPLGSSQLHHKNVSSPQSSSSSRGSGRSSVTSWAHSE